MSFSPAQLQALQAPLASSAVKHREQSGRQLSYVEGWHVLAEANRIFGFDGWDRETVELKLLYEPIQAANKYNKMLWRVGYSAKVRITVRADGRAATIVREGVGYGSGIDADLGSAHESAAKESETDATKRALMTFGNPFGLALYDKEQRNVVDDTSPRNALETIIAEPTKDQVELYEVMTKAVTKCETLEKLAQMRTAATESLKALTDAQYEDFKRIYQFKKKALETFSSRSAAA